MHIHEWRNQRMHKQKHKACNDKNIHLFKSVVELYESCTTHLNYSKNLHFSRICIIKLLENFGCLKVKWCVRFAWITQHYQSFALFIIFSGVSNVSWKLTNNLCARTVRCWQVGCHRAGAAITLFICVKQILNVSAVNNSSAAPHKLVGPKPS